jgi:predicted adenylyl cyclase CyaB
MAPGSPKNSATANSFRTFILKAHVESAEQMEAAIFNFTQTIGHVVVEEDVYFSVPNGQMKLRTTQPGHEHGELIAYKQVNSQCANFYETRITSVPEVEKLKNTLALSLAELCTIRKKRRVYVLSNVQINLDDVKDLGFFVDIEVRADAGQTIEELQKQAESVKKALDLKDVQIMAMSYLDLYRKTKSIDSGFDDESNSDA